MDATLELPPLAWGIMGAGRVCHDFVQVRKLGCVRTAVDLTKLVRCWLCLALWFYTGRMTINIDGHASTTVELPYARTKPHRSCNQLDSPDLPRGQALKSVPHAAKVQTVGCRELDRSIEFADLHGENSPQLPVVFRSMFCWERTYADFWHVELAKHN